MRYRPGFDPVCDIACGTLLVVEAPAAARQAVERQLVELALGRLRKVDSAVAVCVQSNVELEPSACASDQQCVGVPRRRRQADHGRRGRGRRAADQTFYGDAYHSHGSEPPMSSLRHGSMMNMTCTDGGTASSVTSRTP